MKPTATTGLAVEKAATGLRGLVETLQAAAVGTPGHRYPADRPSPLPPLDDDISSIVGPSSPYEPRPPPPQPGGDRWVSVPSPGTYFLHQTSHQLPIPPETYHQVANLPDLSHGFIRLVPDASSTGAEHLTTYVQALDPALREQLVLDLTAAPDPAVRARTWPATPTRWGSPSWPTSRRCHRVHRREPRP